MNQDIRDLVTFPDGTIDPVKAATELMRNTDPDRLRARVFKPVVESLSDLKRQIATLENELAGLRQDAWCVKTTLDVYEQHLTTFRGLLTGRYPAADIDALFAAAEDAVADLYDQPLPPPAVYRDALFSAPGETDPLAAVANEGGGE